MFVYCADGTSINLAHADVIRVDDGKVTAWLRDEPYVIQKFESDEEARRFLTSLLVRVNGVSGPTPTAAGATVVRSASRFGAPKVRKQ